MPNRRHQYYVGDDVMFRGVFKADCVELTPADNSVLVSVFQRGNLTPIIDNVAGSISGNQIRYFYENLPEGTYSIYLTATYNNGADQRTGVIEYVVYPKGVR